MYVKKKYIYWLEENHKRKKFFFNLICQSYTVLRAARLMNYKNAYCQNLASDCESVFIRVAAKPHIQSLHRSLTLPLCFVSQNHPVPEAAEDQGAAAESDWGLWPADGHVLHGEGGTRTTGQAPSLSYMILLFFFPFKIPKLRSMWYSHDSCRNRASRMHCSICMLLLWNNGEGKGHVLYVFLSFQLLLPLKTQEDLDQAVQTLGSSSGANGLLRILLKTPKNNHVSPVWILTAVTVHCVQYDMPSCRVVVS